MADLSVTPVATGIRPPPTMSLGEMVNLARGVQAYKSGEISLTLEQQRERERNLMQQFLANPENFQTNGRIDIDKMNAQVPSLAPLTGSEYINKFTTLATAQTQAMDAKQKLTQDQRNMIGSRFGILGRLGVQDKEAYLREMDLLVKENPDNTDLARLIDAYKTTWRDIPSGPQLPAMAIAGANTLLSPATQQQFFAPQAGQISTGAATFPTTTTASPAGLPPQQVVGQTPLAVAQLPPQVRTVPTGQVDINNQPIFNVFSPSGQFVGQAVAPSTPTAAQMPGGAPLTPTGAPARPMAPPPAPPPAPGVSQIPGAVPMTRQTTIAPDTAAELTAARQAAAQNIPVAQVAPTYAPVTRIRPGETPQTLAEANAVRNEALKSALTVPQQTFNNNQIIRLADEALTGKGAGLLANLTGGYAAFNAVGIGGGNATALNELGHYMALQTAALSASAGLGTDAARNIAAESTGTVNWTPDAIRKTARVNRALATATELYNQGIQDAFNRTRDPYSARDFQNRWSQVADVNAIRLYDAMKNNDVAAAKEIVDALGGPQSSGYKDLRDKINRMRSIVGAQ